MHTFKVVILGQDTIERSTLIRQLVDPEYQQPPAHSYAGIIGADFQNLKAGSITIGLWSLSELPRYASIVSMHCRSANLGIYCIDLSRQLNPEHWTRMEEQIGTFRERNANSPILLVGTGSDTHPDSLHLLNVTQQQSSHTFAELFATSADQADGITQLRSCILAAAKRANNTLPQRLYFQARELIPETTSLYQALNQLAWEANKVGMSIKECMDARVTALIEGLINPEISDKNKLINQFIEECSSCVPPKSNALMRAVFCVAISALIIVLAGAMGFGIGFALGSLFGPAALVTGLVSAGSFAICAAVHAIPYTCDKFFKPRPVEEHISQVASRARSFSPTENWWD